MLYCVLSSKSCSHASFKEMVQPQKTFPARELRHKQSLVCHILLGLELHFRISVSVLPKRDSHIHLSLPVTLLSILLLAYLLL
ncbi:hypothetical protein U0070_003403 [Myodes glareolus]|uniref:Uncharacterized protein n=1 Tax=Myodes glareolus TaxID=447135 RepID=A0AAW0JT86_MYOGA